ncbi:G-type lectin S-receptor-like serine/threonine-protein kinase LECRK1 [Elaeis guineensis]|uniref:G-type lectin S-receptor-like serine/threonine-protein kinase LECRK1 n=1 Tax=Elaeis guineensis var. tenera TaxID=51953 RepID=UPI003C6D4E33
MAMASESHILCLLLFLFPLSITAQTKGRITLGSSLSTLEENTSWASPSGEFAFGFRRIADTNLYLLATWFDKIPNKTITWYPTPSNTDPTVQTGSEVKLTSDGQLVLSDQNGQEIWSAETSNVSYAAMLDTGNFVLASNGSSYLWQSFDHPSHTLLPGQVLDPSNSLFSHQSDSNYSIGKFQLQMLNGNVVLNPIALPTKNSYDAYWTSTNTQGSGSSLSFDLSGYVYIEMWNGSSVNLTSGDTSTTKEFYQRVTLDPDGVLRKYIYPRNGTTGSWKPSWSTSWWVPEDICNSALVQIGSGICGFNSYCILEDGRPTCGCPPMYSYLDPNNTRNGCKPDFIAQSCDTDASEAGVTYVIQDLLGANWPTSDYERLTPMNEGDCRRACLEDCFCAVAIFGSAGCWKKKLPLSNGRGHENDAKALIKVAVSISSLPSPPQELLERKRNRSKLIPVGAAMLGISVLINLFLLSGIALSLLLPCCRKSKRLHQDSDCKRKT